MWRTAAGVALVAGLASCGSTNEDGSAAAGPLGQQLLMTPEVQVATRQGVDACIDALQAGAPLSVLATDGFVSWRGGYRRAIDNPLIFAGDSAVAVRFDGRDCRVRTGPIYPVEVQTLRSITGEALQQRGQGIGDVSFRRSSDSYEIILR